MSEIEINQELPDLVNAAIARLSPDRALYNTDRLLGIRSEVLARKLSQWLKQYEFFAEMLKSGVLGEHALIDEPAALDQYRAVEMTTLYEDSTWDNDQSVYVHKAVPDEYVGAIARACLLNYYREHSDDVIVDVLVYHVQDDDFILHSS